MREGQTLGEWSRKREPMRDEGDMMADDPPPINCRAIVILTLIAWAILTVVAIGILKLFHYA